MKVKVKCLKCERIVWEKAKTHLCVSCCKFGHKPRLGKKTSDITKEKQRTAHMGPTNYLWKNEVKYAGLHMWIRRWFGVANRCENPNCSYTNPKRFEWALVSKNTGKNGIYTKCRSDFIMLCPSCHRRYDNGNLVLDSVIPSPDEVKL